MKIDRSELLRYLGYRGQEYSQNIEDNLALAVSLCLDKITPRSIVKKYELVKEPLALKGTDTVLQGKDVAKHLEGCKEVYIFGATVGFEVERYVDRLMKDNALLGIMVDSASICAIESYCDDICEELQRQNSRQLTMRFSCGYGDFPLSQQRDFARLLEMHKRIGVFLNEDSMMMSPQKSVTAIVGIKESEREDSVEQNCSGKCMSCGKAECEYRKG